MIMIFMGGMMDDYFAVKSERLKVGMSQEKSKDDRCRQEIWILGLSKLWYRNWARD